MSDLKAYAHQCLIDTKRWFPEIADNLNHHALSLAGEVGEFCNLLKKVERGDCTFEEARAELAEEGIDVFIYLANIFALLGVDPDKVYAIKRAKNERRFGGRNGEAQ